MGEAAKPIPFEGVKSIIRLSCCFAWQAWKAWHFATFPRVCKRVERRFVWQAQYFCDVSRRWDAVFVASTALRRPPSSFCVAGAALQTCRLACSTLHTLHFILHTLHSTLYTLHSTLYTLHHSTLDTLHFTFYTLHSTLYTPHFYTLHFTLHTLHFTLHTLHSTLYTPHFALYTFTPHFTIYTLHSTLYSPHSTLYTLHSTLFTLHNTLHSTLYTPHSTLYNPHLTLDTPHFTLHTLHFTTQTLHSTLQTLHFTLYTLHSTLYTLHSPLYTPHFTFNTSHSTLHTLHSTLHSLHFTLDTLHSFLFHIPQSTVLCYGNGEKCPRLFTCLVPQKCSTWLHSGSWAASCLPSGFIKRGNAKSWENHRTEWRILNSMGGISNCYENTCSSSGGYLLKIKQHGDFPYVAFPAKLFRLTPHFILQRQVRAAKNCDQTLASHQQERIKGSPKS